MAQIDGLPILKAKIKALKDKANSEPAVTGYTAPYALYVHENMEAHHQPGKQAKFLEAPSRNRKDELKAEWLRVYKSTKDATAANLAAALLLQRFGQELVPVATGFLRSTAFTCLEKDLPENSNPSLTVNK